MSNFQQYTGSESRVYPTLDLTVANGDVVDFGGLPVPTDGHWTSHAGPATKTFDNTVTESPVLADNPATGALTTAHDAYAAKGTEALGRADSGHVWGLVSSISGVKQAPGDASGISVVSGAATNSITAASPAAGYATLDAGAPITRLAADIAFSSSSTDGGTGVLVPWATDITGTFPEIPDSDSHVTVAPAGWTWSIFRSNVITTIASGSWRPGFAWGTGTFRRVEVALSDGVGYLTGPDGVTYPVTDSRIGETAVQYGCFETYQGTAASTDARASFRNVAFDTVPAGPDRAAPTHAEIGRRLAGAQALIVPQSAALSYGPGIAAEYPMPDAQAVIDATNLSLPFAVPASGNTRCRPGRLDPMARHTREFLLGDLHPRDGHVLQPDTDGRGYLGHQ